MSTLLSDNFNRANSSTLIGSPQVGPAPVVLGGVGGITSNTLYAATATLNAVWDLGTVNVEVSATATGTQSGRTLGFTFGTASLTDHYLVVFDFDTVRIYRSNPGGFMVLMQAGAGITAAATACKASYKDGVIRVYVNGVQLMDCLVPLIPTNTRAGVRLTHASSIRVDNLLAEDAPALPPDVVASGDVAADLLTQGNPFIPVAFPYRGRNTKALDIAGGA